MEMILRPDRAERTETRIVMEWMKKAARMKMAALLKKRRS
jgi:hypothetical protein